MTQLWLVRSPEKPGFPATYARGHQGLAIWTKLQREGRSFTKDEATAWVAWFRGKFGNSLPLELVPAPN